MRGKPWTENLFEPRKERISACNSHCRRGRKKGERRRKKCGNFFTVDSRLEMYALMMLALRLETRTARSGTDRSSPVD